MRFNDGVIGAVVATLAVLIILHTRTFPTVPGREFGSAVFPRIIGVGLLLCSLNLLVAGWRSRSATPLVAWGDWIRSPRHVLGFAAVIVSLLFYIWASGYLGFILTGTVLLVGLMVVFGTRVWVAVALAVPIIAGVQLFFSNLLRVPLPSGILGW